MTQLLTIADMRRAGRDLAAPFRFALEAVTLPQEMEVLEIHRLLPGKRLTARARWCGLTVLVKVFFDRSGYRRHWQREAAGLAAMLQAGIATPRILGQAENRSLRAALVVTEYLPEACTLADLPEDAAERQPAMAAALALLAKMHAAGLEQRDIHPGNFLWAGGTLHAVDGDGILRHGKPLTGAPALENLALFLAQFTPAQLENLSPLAHYLPAEGLDGAALDQAVRRHRDGRWRAYAEKLLRNCTDIRCLERWNRFVALRRDGDDEPLRDLLADPDRYIAEAELLKDGNSSTVALVQLPGRSLVVKRYNIKNWRHRLSRCWRPSRARHSWLNAHHLRFLGIATPQPVAFLERRCGPWRGAAYYIAEHVAGEPLSAKPANKAQVKTAAPVACLLKQLFDAQLAHGDMKASNILCGSDQPYVLDLDAMAWITQRGRFLRAYRVDRQRFLDNWPEGNALRQWFDANLPPAEEA